MSVLIKGMKIPKNCTQCEWYEKYGGDYDWCHACRLTGSMPIDNAETGRADDCPLETYEPCTDTISRQAAIDALEKVAALFPWKVPGNRDSYDRYNEAWNDAIGRAEIEIEELPSAQPEIIHCRDCKKCQVDSIYHDYWCDGRKVWRDHYCGYAERRTDE